MSAIEAVTNTAVGFFISWVLTITVLPLFGYAVTFGHSLGITMVYTAASIARSFALRRLFNAKSATQTD